MRPQRIRKSAVIIKPATVTKFRRALSSRNYHILFSYQRSGKPGPKGPSDELIRVIVEMKKRNPRFGCPRIAQQISTAFGIEINKDKVRRVLAKHYRPGSNDGGPSWRTFIGHQTDSLRSINWFRWKWRLFKNNRLLGMLNWFIRQTIGYNIHCGPVDEIARCPLLENATLILEAQKPLNSHHDPPIIHHRWNTMLFGMGETDTIPILPLSLPWVEWRMGKVDCNNLGHLPYYNAVDFERELEDFKNFYTLSQLHSPIAENTSAQIDKSSALRRSKVDHFAWERHRDELFETPISA